MTMRNCEFWIVIYYVIIKGQVTPFLRSKAATALARVSHHESVCPSICSSHGWDSQKRCKVGSPSLHRQLEDSSFMNRVRRSH